MVSPEKEGGDRGVVDNGQPEPPTVPEPHPSFLHKPRRRRVSLHANLLFLPKLHQNPEQRMHLQPTPNQRQPVLLRLVRHQV
jgi:hypothetical protein